MKNEKLLEVGISAAMRAGKCLMDNYLQGQSFFNKESHRDIATSVDVSAEKEVFSVLRKFDKGIPILSEEHGFQGGNGDSGECWVVDALDGTVNYLNQIPFFSVSIAYFKNNQPIIGVVYAPLVDDIYYASEGIGAFKNQHKIFISDQAPENSLFSASFSGKNRDPSGRDEEFLLFGHINDLSRGCLRTGSAALNLAYLAEGRFNGCWGKANKDWDIGAGLLIAKMAGANVVRYQSKLGGNLSHYIAGTPLNFTWLQDQVGRHMALL